MLRPIMLALPVAAGLFVSLAPSAAQPPAQGKRYALVVGVNEYDNRKLDALKFAEADAKDLAAVLAKSGYEVRLLLGSSAGDSEATAANVRAAFEKMLRGVKQHDTVLIGLSGHGAQLFVGEGEAKKETPFFCAKDARPTDGSSMVSLHDMMRKLDADGGSYNLMLVDACRNVVDPNNGGLGAVGSRVPDLGINTVAVFSCGRRQMSRETEKAGGGHGVFFHHVLEGLRGGATDAKGRVTYTRLLNYLAENVGESAGEWFPGVAEPERQRPVARGNFDDDVVLIELGTRRVGRGPLPGEEREVEIAKGVKMVFCWVPAGKVMLGSPKDEKGRRDEEKEPFEYTTKGFWMDKYEVTQGQYEAVAGTNPSWFCPAGGGKEKVKGLNTSRHPVENVSWDDCQAFVKKLTVPVALGRGKFALPHEDEWEYAARSDTNTAFSFGGDSADLDGYGWYEGNADGMTRPVGAKRPNRWGLCDTHGNAWEWCENQYAPDGTFRALRGGSWGSVSANCRSAFRAGVAPAERGNIYGFRLVFRPD